MRRKKEASKVRRRISVNQKTTNGQAKREISSTFKEGVVEAEADRKFSVTQKFKPGTAFYLYEPST